jgi:hypothetical protein
MPSSGSCLALASRFSKRSVSRESIQPDCRLHRCLRHQVSLLTLCPLGQPKKAIGRESEIEPWLTHAQRNRLACPRFRKSTGVHICFPSSAMLSERSSPSRVRFAAPHGAPLTAPGRSEERFLPRGKGREYKPAAASASRWSALTTLRPGAEIRKILPGSQPTRIPGRSRPRTITSQRTGQKRVDGAECRDQSSAHFSSREKYFLLTFPLIEQSSGQNSLGPQTISSAHPLVSLQVPEREFCTRCHAATPNPT